MDGEYEARLVARAASGEAEAFRGVFEAHNAAMFRLAYRLTSAADAAEDITQECFLRLMRRPALESRRGSLRQYLYGIVRNLARQRQQANGREVHWDDDAGEGVSSGASLPDPMASAEVTAVVQSALAALPPLQREAILLCEFEELSLDEVAAIVGAEVGTVARRNGMRRW